MIFGPTQCRKEADRLIAISQEIPSNPDRTRAGGVLTVGLEGFSQKYVLNLGTYSPNKREKYTRLSQEKAHRVYANWLRQPEVTVSSWQTRNPEEMMFGGAVLFPPIDESPNIISFSGLAEVTDEALCLVLAYHLGLSPVPNYANRVIEISKNPVYEELLKRAE